MGEVSPKGRPGWAKSAKWMGEVNGLVSASNYYERLHRFRRLCRLYEDNDDNDDHVNYNN
jgi:hypothetical protein